jgi:hypothetical protein
MDILLLNARTVRKQPTGIQIKKIVSKMLTICSLFVRQASLDARKDGDPTHLIACPILLNRVLSD